ncbi:hypothetical protein H8D36_03400 [archaeon]|nr:hypothetical protein [archaeon]
MIFLSIVFITSGEKPEAVVEDFTDTMPLNYSIEWRPDFKEESSIYVGSNNHFVFSFDSTYLSEEYCEGDTLYVLYLNGENFGDIIYIEGNSEFISK